MIPHAQMLEIVTDEARTGEVSAEEARYPALPGGMTRDEAIEGLREIARMAEEHQRETDPSFVRWPDLDAMLDYLEANGFPPPDNSILSGESAALSPQPID